jgi:bloom syndrome protein
VPPQNKRARAESGGTKWNGKKGAARKTSWAKGKPAAGGAVKKRAPAAKKQSSIAKFSYDGGADPSKKGGGGGTSSGIGMMPL